MAETWETSMRAQRAAELRSRSDLPRKYLWTALDDFVIASAKQAQVHAAVVGYVKHFAAHLSSGVSLTFSGPPGTGKTMLGCAVINALIETGRSARYTTVMLAQRALRATWHRGAGDTEQHILDTMVGPELLVIDEAGTAGTDAEKATLFDLVDARYMAGRPSLVITNAPPKTMAGALGARVVDRLQEAGGKTIAFPWESVRAKVDRLAQPPAKAADQRDGAAA